MWVPGYRSPMAYRVHELTATGRLAFAAQAVDGGGALVITVHTGQAVIVTDAGMMVSSSGGDNGGPIGFFVPEVPPLAGDATAPEVIAEVYLVGVVVHSFAGRDTNYGVSDVTAAYVPDPRGGDARWLSLTCTARAVRGLRIGYRVTLTQRG